jgi:uncharacterized membrane protein required for colicin V production
MDVFALIFLAFFVFQGAQRGIVRVLIDVFAVLLAIFASSTLYKLLSSSVMPFLKVGDKAGYVITFAIFFVIFMMLLDILASALQKVVNVSFHSGIETLGGSALGFIKGLLIIGVIIQLLVLYPFHPQIKDAVDRSLSKQLALPTLRQTYSSVFVMFPRIDFFIQERVIPVTPKQVPGK